MKIRESNIFSVTITSGSPQGILNLVLNSYRLTVKSCAKKKSLKGVQLVISILVSLDSITNVSCHLLASIPSLTFLF